MNQTASTRPWSNLNSTECGNARKHAKSGFMKAEKVFTEFSFGKIGQAYSLCVAFKLTTPVNYSNF